MSKQMNWDRPLTLCLPANVPKERLNHEVEYQIMVYMHKFLPHLTRADLTVTKIVEAKDNTNVPTHTIVTIDVNPTNTWMNNLYDDVMGCDDD